MSFHETEFMHNPWPFINTFEAKQHYKHIFGGIFFFIVNTVFKKVKTIKCSFYEFIYLKNDTVNIGIFDHFQYNH